ncbi:hypothetical protein M8J77_024510 [Diaphorina citri]|nr:hypothetical protein M8J77_024510 [Diaphorina citri]
MDDTSIEECVSAPASRMDDSTNMKECASTSASRMDDSTSMDVSSCQQSRMDDSIIDECASDDSDIFDEVDDVDKDPDYIYGDIPKKTFTRSLPFQKIEFLKGNERKSNPHCEYLDCNDEVFSGCSLCECFLCYTHFLLDEIRRNV